MSKVSVKSLRRLANMLPDSADVVAGALVESADYIEELENLITTMTDKIVNLQKQLEGKN